jgi:hypothetical protein
MMMTSDCLPHQVLAALERSLLEPQGVRAGEVRWSAMECDGVRLIAIAKECALGGAMECDLLRLRRNARWEVRLIGID